MEHDNTDKLPQQTSPVEQPEGESSQAEVDKTGDTIARKLGEKGTRAALLTDEEVKQIEARIAEVNEYKTLMEAPPKGINPNNVRAMQNSMALQHDLAHGVKPPLEVGDK